MNMNSEIQNLKSEIEAGALPGLLFLAAGTPPNSFQPQRFTLQRFNASTLHDSTLVHLVSKIDPTLSNKVLPGVIQAFLGVKPSQAFTR